jgi:hypothetical protein
MWLVISLILNLWPLGSLMLGRYDLRLLGSLLLGRSVLRPRFVHLLLACIIQSLNKGPVSLSGGRSALQTKIMIKHIK